MKAISKPVLIAAVIGLLVLAGGTVYLLTRNDIGERPAAVSGPMKDSENQTEFKNLPEPVTQSGQQPTGTIAPADLIMKPQDYLGKSVKVYGRILEVKSGTYFVVDPQNNQGAISLVVNTDKKPLLANLFDNQKLTTVDGKPIARTSTKAVVLVGTFAQTDKSPATLTLSSIE